MAYCSLVVCINYCLLLRCELSPPLLSVSLLLSSSIGLHTALGACCSPGVTDEKSQLLQHTSGWVQRMCGGSGGGDVDSQGRKWASEDCRVSFRTGVYSIISFCVSNHACCPHLIYCLLFLFPTCKLFAIRDSAWPEVKQAKHVIALSSSHKCKYTRYNVRV